MTKDVTLYSRLPLRGLFEVNRFNDIFDEFDRIWKDWTLDTRSFADIQPKSSFPKVNVIETKSAYEVDIALAGFSKEDISLELKEGCLLIKADKKQEECSEGSGRKCLMKEISYRSFRRSLIFPKEIEADKIDCTYKNGIVKCILSKKKEDLEKPDAVVIDIK